MASKSVKSKRGGKRPGSGRKRNGRLREAFLSARTTPEVKEWIEQLCKKENITESTYLHLLIKKDRTEREVLATGKKPEKKVMYVLQQVEID